MTLGSLCETGDGGPVDIKSAINQGYATPQYKLGWSYATGKNSSKDLTEARYGLRPAGEQGESLALYALSVMAATGQGETQDCLAAFAFLTASAKHGYQEALTARNQIAPAMTSTQIQRGYEMVKSWEPATENRQ